MEACLYSTRLRTAFIYASRASFSRTNTYTLRLSRTPLPYSSPLRNLPALDRRFAHSHHPAKKIRKDLTVMATSVELASVPSADTPGTCIYVHNEKISYVFGRVAEGTQRAFGSRKLHIGGTDHVFLSGPVCWEQLGGLIGYLLSVGGALDAAKEQIALQNKIREDKGQKLINQTGREGVDVHGADNLAHLLATARAVLFRQPISVRLHEQQTDPRAADPNNLEPDWSDAAIRVWKVPVRRARSSSPHKRMRNSDEPKSSQTDASQSSEAEAESREVARLVVEKLMFNGSLSNELSVLQPKRVGELTPEDKAIISREGVLSLYKGPYSGEGVDVPRAGDTAWVFTDKGVKATSTLGKDEKPDAFFNSPALPQTNYSESSLSYIVKCHERRGKFNAARAKELKVLPKLFSQLTSGKSVTSQDGAEVTPNMVLGEPQPGKGFAVADIPSVDFLDSFFERPEWTNKELMEHVVAMYWILGDGIAEEARIKKFTQDHAHIKHVFCSNDTCPNMITHPGAAEGLARLRRIDPERFPILDYNNTVKYAAPESDSSIELGRAGAKIQLMPRILMNDGAVAPFTDLVAPFNDVPEDVVALAEKIKTEVSSPAFLERVAKEESDIPNRDAEIIPLGTGSSVPSKYRNVSSTLIRVPGIGNYLFDCGEGTIGQLLRLFGEEETKDVLRNLKCVVVSHLHADHHLGAATLIKAWYEQTLKDGSSAKLAVSCINRYRELLEEVSQVEDIGFHRLSFPSSGTPATQNIDEATLPADGDNFGLKRIRRVKVPHCWRSYATELELTSGLRMAYSGDCRPSSEFASVCRGAHLLIHECTFGDDMQSHAKAKKHSTMGEALGVARDMQARRTLLTHFSQRYTKSDSLRRTQADGNVLLAFDFMRVKLGDFQAAAKYVPAVELLMEKLGEA